MGRQHDQQGYGLKGAWKKLKADFPKRLLHHIKDLWVEWRREKGDEHEEGWHMIKHDEKELADGLAEIKRMEYLMGKALDELAAYAAKDEDDSQPKP